MLETGIGRATSIAFASLPHFSLPADIPFGRRYYREDLTSSVFTLTANGTIAVPSEPGIGVDVDLKMLEKVTVKKLSMHCS